MGFGKNQRESKVVFYSIETIGRRDGQVEPCHQMCPGECTSQHRVHEQRKSRRRKVDDLWTADLGLDQEMRVLF